MANPFSVTPTNPLAALMAFDQSYEGARKQRQENEAKAALAQFSQQNPQLGPIAQLIGSGNVPAAQAISNMELARTNADWTRRYQGGMLDLANRREHREANEPKYIQGTDDYGNPTIQVVPRHGPTSTAPVGTQPGQVMPSYGGEPPRAPVPSTSRVVGDQEAVSTGLYDSPVTVAQAGRAAVPQAPASPIPPPPPGVNRREWIKKFSTEAAETASKQPQAETALANAASNLSRLKVEAQKIKNDPDLWRAVGLLGVYNVPGFAGADVEARIESLKSQVAFGVLQEMRNASKTGGALGAVSEKELALLESNLAALSTKQSPSAFRKSLDQIIEYAGGAENRLKAAYKSTYPGSKIPDAPPPQESKRLRFNPQTGDLE